MGGCSDILLNAGFLSGQNADGNKLGIANIWTLRQNLSYSEEVMGHMVGKADLSDSREYNVDVEDIVSSGLGGLLMAHVRAVGGIGTSEGLI